MAKPELGTKRTCPVTGRKFYDLNKDPVISPYSGEIVPIVVAPPPRVRAESARTPSKACRRRTTRSGWGRRWTKLAGGLPSRPVVALSSD